jgi:hypothetical protein
MLAAIVERTRHVRRPQRLASGSTRSSLFWARARSARRCWLTPGRPSHAAGDVIRPGAGRRPCPPGRSLLALAPLRGIVVLDAIHRSSEIFPVLWVLADRPPGGHALPGARQCIARPAAPDLRVAGRPDRLRRTCRVKPCRSASYFSSPATLTSVAEIIASPAHRRARTLAEAVLNDALLRLAGGADHTCKVKEDGTVRCWGRYHVATGTSHGAGRTPV